METMQVDPVTELQEQIRLVHEARDHQALLVDLKKKRLDEWEQEHAGLLSDIVDNSRFLADAEALLRETLIRVYQETGNKQPAPGVGIREVTRLEYDAQVAFLWATEHKMALKLDISAFEKIAKASPPEFVKTLTVPQATIATNLSEYVKG